MDEIAAYYRSIGDAAQLPVFIQHTHSDMDLPFIGRLLEELEHVQYVKEEMPPSAHNISALRRVAGGRCLGVFGGAHGRWMLSELQRGATGFMPAAEAVDVHVQVWDAYHAGEEARARDIFDGMLPLINLVQILGLRVCKEVLVLRGVFGTSEMRAPDSLALDEEDRRELDSVLGRLSGRFRL